MEYRFQLHEATFTLLTQGVYTGIITVTQKNGLLATYYETIGFSAPVLLESLHFHVAALGADTYAVSGSTGDGTHYTRLDPAIDFDLGRDSMLRALIPLRVSSFPTQHFSVWWRGFLQAPASSLYRIHIESYEAAYFKLEISGETLIVSEFKNENELSMIRPTKKNSALSADIWLEQGSRVPITLRYAEKLGPTKLRLLWESDSMARVVIPPECLYHTLGSQTTPFPLSVNPAPTVATASSLSNDVDYRFAVVDLQETLILNARDAFMNQQMHQDDIITATLVDA